jgi:two-component system CheB/CheR fusion protein
VSTANDARAALALLAAQSFDLLLSDISMQDMTGDIMLAEIRRRPGVARLPAIAVTGRSPAGQCKPGGKGFDAIVTKPIDMDVLLASIAGVVSAGQAGALAA